MICFKIYYRSVWDKYGIDKKTLCRFEGWFLFGLIPIYTSQITYPT